MEDKINYIISILNDLQEKAQDLRFKMEYNKSNCTVLDIFDFPENVEDVLFDVINQLDELINDNYISESKNIELHDESEDTNHEVISDTNIDNDSFEECGYQYIDTKFAKELHIPKQYENILVASRKYKAIIKYLDKNNKTQSRTHDFYEFCIDPGADNVTTALNCWYMDDKHDIVFSNEYCNIYKIQGNLLNEYNIS